ncbi:AAA family ATPase [Rhodococcus kroppenstedtii]|uniref:AAA family ATPase n=1 Tax=Rhodococcoides kroppenstedtii TaxID=293050 RepID=UPI002954DB2E|nr:AAA family ATPase [Rhodococcus kroppenstedtii]MDV7196904.1 AAA family ATPase [Rhodococcus kroppenstedtii]
MAETLATAVAGLSGDVGARHDVMTRATASLARLAEQGHSGTEDAIDTLRERFVTAVEVDRGGAAVAVREFDTALTGALTKVAQTPTPPTGEPDDLPSAAELIGIGAATTQPEAAQSNRPRARAVSEMAKAEPLEWLAEGRIPRGKVGLLIGEEGAGKSLWWVWLVGKLTRGAAAPEFGVEAGPPMSVTLIVNADGWSDTVLPRLVVAGVDLDRLTVVSVDADGEGTPVLPDDLDVLPTNSDLLVVDEWLTTVPSGKSVKDAQVARALLVPIKDWAERTGTAVVLVSHTNRVATGSSRDAYANTSELRKVARFSLLLAKDRDNPNGFTIGVEKSNLAGAGAALRFVNTVADFDIDGVTGTTGICRYSGEADETASELFAQARDETDDSESKDATDWLREFLEDHNGSAESALVLKAAKANLVSDRALAKAKRKVLAGGRPQKQKGVKDGPWLWILDT